MAQRNRYDEPGSIHHVGNRGLAKRTAFESREDIRKFLAEIARAVRAGWIEVLAYCVLATHFHLLLRSPRGEMWRGLRRAQNVYVRHFNRRRRRDGPLFRGRFWSRRVWSRRYRRLVVRYIDHNSVKAGVVQRPAEYPHGSAAAYTGRSAGPRWLERSIVEEMAMEWASPGADSPERYERAFGEPLSLGEEELLDRRMRSRSAGPDPLDDLLGATSERVRAWMLRKATLADGTAPGQVLVAPSMIVNALSEAGLDIGNHDADSLTMMSGLLRELGGATAREAGQLCRVSYATAMRRMHRHRMRLVLDEDYAARAATLGACALAAQWPSRGASS